jgi:hypothetical protein
MKFDPFQSCGLCLAAKQSYNHAVSRPLKKMPKPAKTVLQQPARAGEQRARESFGSG